MAYDIKVLRTYKRGPWVKGQFFLMGVLFTFKYNIKNHELQYNGVADGKTCDPWYIHHKYGLNKFGLEDSIEEYAVTWWAKQLKTKGAIAI